MSNTAGQMDTLVTVETCTIGRGDKGQKIYTWAFHSKVWAKVERQVSEAIDNGNLEEGQSLLLTIYKIKDLSTRWRFIVNGQPYQVTAIDPLDRLSPFARVSVQAMEG